MHINIPDLSMILLIGPSGSGKSTFARRWFKETEVVSSDHCRALISDSENDQFVTPAAFKLVHEIARLRLANGRRVVIDATSVEPEARASLVALAREMHVFAVAIVFDLPARVCIERNQQRQDRRLGPHVVQRQLGLLHKNLRHLREEGFRHVWTLRSETEVEAVDIQFNRMWTDRRDLLGPFDIIGDIHGCFEELCLLLERLGYVQTEGQWAHPAGRKVIFLGDIVDRGPGIVQVLRLVMGMVQSENALCVLGNHEQKLLKKLGGATPKLTHGLAETMAQLDAETPVFRSEVAAFLDKCISHYVLDKGQLVVAHAGMPEHMQGRSSGAVREFALYGETTGETDEYGLPVRYAWAADYRGRALVVYGHTPVVEASWENNTVCVDTGCVFGGKLSALRYPEREVISVPALQMYYAPLRPLQAAPVLKTDTLVDIEDLTGKLRIPTDTGPVISISAENAAAALEAISRFAIDPRWLIYLPPTMSPCETSQADGYLERPEQALEDYRREGQTHVVCELKHMGSRAVVVVCRDETVGKRRFGSAEIGKIYTRTGRAFFDTSREQALLLHLQKAITDAGSWERLKTDWLLLDCELMPWSLKAQELIRSQYAPVGAAAAAALPAAVSALQAASNRGVEMGVVLAQFKERAATIDGYNAAWARYCWETTGLAEIRLAPFHLLASEGQSWMKQDHGWHLAELARIIEKGAPILHPNRFREVDLSEASSVAAAVDWWEEMTAAGWEGMVVKPWEFTAQGSRGIIQPAIKCRGREYLRIIYGPEYTRPEHLQRLRQRALRSKRSLAIREFLLGAEGIARFVRGEPIGRVHPCVFGVLALESEPVDPRL